MSVNIHCGTGLSESDELVSIAWLAVERAINDYKPEKGYKFTA